VCVETNIMSSAIAQKVFRTPLARSCAQAIYRGFQESCDISEATIDSAIAYGGGRASGGTCGALYAALSLAPENCRQEMRQRFAEVAGDSCCRPIRQINQLDCPGCVALAADLLEEYLT